MLPRLAFSAVVTAALAIVPVSAPVALAADVSQTWNYTGSTATFTVPTGVTALTVTLVGAEGGQGGPDSSGPSPAGGYRGVVTGTIVVTPGDDLTIAVGSGGASGSGGGGNPDPAHYTDGATAGGQNPLGQYNGGDGGAAGYQGSSGFGGAGGAATVVEVAGATIVAGGAGGSGGSGQYAPLLGRLAASSFAGRTDTVSTDGQVGITVATVCTTACDGGGSGGGGGGATGGDQGAIEFGSGTYTEWFGYGGSPGANATGGLSGLTASYQYYGDNNADGWVEISYPHAAPDAPTALTGTIGDGTIGLSWTAPASSGLASISDYIIEYALETNPTVWSTFSDGTSTATSASVTGLTDGTSYIFRVTAVNSYGDGTASDNSVPMTPSGPPAAPTINSVTAADGALSVSFTAGSSDSPILDYEYELDGDGTWVSLGATASPLTIAGLANGTAHTVALRAVNMIGAGAPSSASSAKAPIAVPGPPTITYITAEDTTAVVAFAPGHAGGATVTDYEYQLNGGAWVSAGTTTSPFTITGLTASAGYDVVLRAVNSAGDGSASTTMSIVTAAATRPTSPTITSVARDDASLVVGVDATGVTPQPTTGWQYSTDAGTTWRDAGTTSPLTMSVLSSDGTPALTNGTTHGIAVRTNDSGATSVASLVTYASPTTTPGAPSITLTPADQRISVAFTVSDAGGSAVSAIQYKLDGGGWVDAGTITSPFVIAGLTNGTSHTVSVRAVNVAGPGAGSTSASATPATVPGAPTAVAAPSASKSAAVSWTAPADDGGSAVTGYTATAYASATSTTAVATCTSTTSSCSIGSLTDGTTYYVVVVASNNIGAGRASLPRVKVTPVSPPGAPTLNSLTAGDSYLLVNFTPGAAGTTTTTGYEYRLDGGAWKSVFGTTSPVAISGLSNGTGYSVEFRALSDSGDSAASNALSGTPSGYPDAPDSADIVASGDNNSVEVTWTAPDDDGSAITGYTVAAFDAATAGSQNATCSTAGALTCALTGLTNGTTYYISIQATNAIGSSARSDPRVAATPSSLPGAVSAVTGVAGDRHVDVSWTPGTTGASAITDYTVWYSSGGSYVRFDDGVSTSTSATLTGLRNGTAYTFEVYAVNSDGTGPASAPSAAVTPHGTPGASPPTIPTPPVRITIGANDSDTGGAGDAAAAVAAAAVAASVAEFPQTDSANAVVIVRADDYADAVVATPLTTVRNAPLLFAPNGILDTQTIAEIQRVLAPGGMAYLVGGADAVAPGVGETLTGLGYQVTRLGGADRYRTALAVAGALGDPGTVLLATGASFADPLAAAPAAAHVHGVVLLTAGTALPADVSEYLAKHGTTTYSVGGPASVADPDATALAGADRYATASSVASSLFGAPPCVGIASGTTYRGGVIGSAYEAHFGGPLILSAPTALPAAATGYLDDVKVSVVRSRLFGDESDLGAGVSSSVANALGW